MKVLVALFVLICLWQKATGTLTAAADVSPAAGALYVANRYIPVLYIPQLVTATSLTAETASASATTMNVMGSTTAITVPTKMAALVRTLRYSLFEVSLSVPSSFSYRHKCWSYCGANDCCSGSVCRPAGDCHSDNLLLLCGDLCQCRSPSQYTCRYSHCACWSSSHCCQCKLQQHDAGTATHE